MWNDTFKRIRLGVFKSRQGGASWDWADVGVITGIQVIIVRDNKVVL